MIFIGINSAVWLRDGVPPPQTLGIGAVSRRGPTRGIGAGVDRGVMPWGMGVAQRPGSGWTVNGTGVAITVSTGTLSVSWAKAPGAPTSPRAQSRPNGRMKRGVSPSPR